MLKLYTIKLYEHIPAVVGSWDMFTTYHHVSNFHIRDNTVLDFMDAQGVHHLTNMRFHIEGEA